MGLYNILILAVLHEFTYFPTGTVKFSSIKSSLSVDPGFDLLAYQISSKSFRIWMNLNHLNQQYPYMYYGSGEVNISKIGRRVVET